MARVPEKNEFKKKRKKYIKALISALVGGWQCRRRGSGRGRGGIHANRNAYHSIALLSLSPSDPFFFFFFFDGTVKTGSQQPNKGSKSSIAVNTTERQKRECNSRPRESMLKTPKASGKWKPSVRTLYQISQPYV